VTLPATQLPGKYFASGTIAGRVVHRFDDSTYSCNVVNRTGEAAIPRLLGINLLRTARFYDSIDDARRAGWDLKIWDKGETCDL
jgi:hypothetical protein